MQGLRFASAAPMRCSTKLVASPLCRFCLASQNTRLVSSSARPTTSTSSNARSYFLLAVPIATFCLGTWQVQRRKWKLALIEELRNMVLVEPVDLPNNLDEIRKLEYRRVRVRGTFDNSQELHVVPRSPVEKDENAPRGGGLITGGPSKSGAHVITAFNLADRDERILVNRGWVPRNKINPATRPEGQINDEIELVGVVRKTEKRPQFGAKNDSGRNQWHFKDQEAMSQALGTAPVLIDAVESSTVPGGPVGGQTRVNLRNEHFSYIVTWYSLSVITFAGWYLRYFKRR